MMKSISTWKQELTEGAHAARLAALYCCTPDETPAQAARYAAVLDGLETTFGAHTEAGLYSAPGRTEIGGNHTDQHLKGGRGRNAAALGHIGGDVHVQTGQLCAALTESLALAAQQGSGGVLLLLAGSQVVKVDDAKVVALALHAKLVQAVGGGSSDHVNVPRAGRQRKH